MFARYPGVMDVEQSPVSNRMQTQLQNKVSQAEGRWGIGWETGEDSEKGKREITASKPATNISILRYAAEIEKTERREEKAGKKNVPKVDKNERKKTLCAGYIGGQ